MSGPSEDVVLLLLDAGVVAGDREVALQEARRRGHYRVVAWLGGGGDDGWDEEVGYGGGAGDEGEVAAEVALGGGGPSLSEWCTAL